MPASEPNPQPIGVRVRLDQLLHDRTALQAGFVLGEVLGPPAAFRGPPEIQ